MGNVDCAVRVTALVVVVAAVTVRAAVATVRSGAKHCEAQV